MELLEWQQELEETPFERMLSVVAARDRARARRGGRRARPSSLRSTERLRGLARLGSPMVRRAARKRLSQALGAARRARPSDARPIRACGGGGGESTTTRPRCRTRPATCCARRSRSRPSRRRRCALEEVRPARSGAARLTCAGGSPRSWGRTPCATTASRASRTRSARATRTSSGSAPATLRARPTRSCTRRRTTRWLAVLELCSAEGVAVTPFGGGSSVVGGVEPRRDGFAAAISLDLARMDRLVEADKRLPARDVRAGLHRAAGRGAACERGPDAGPLPAVVGVRDARAASWRRGRPGRASTGYGRIDELVLGRARWPRRPARSTCRRCPPAPPGPACAAWSSAPRARSGVITQATLAVRPRPGGEAERGLGRSTRGRRAARPSARWSRRATRRTCAACPTRRRRP